ncbi:AAA family ATPase [Staphylococcus hominis]|uniref:AAA family ATPase n=1 Tax=Staphylococcus hominis TaxID=1290 RepID=UPI001F597422|nr:ATP-binding protein [Staphylococcus hominis]MCI2913684.1 ATP-binding protein [Staphylococcus hominis]
MIKKLTLKNYKSFKEIDIDFVNPKKVSSNLNLIYGENGSGKSNIISVFSLLSHLQDTIKSNERFAEVLGKRKDNKQFRRLLSEFPFARMINITNLMKSESISFKGNDEPTEIYIEFLINGVVAEYFLKLDEKRGVLEESLFYLIKKNRGYLFNINRDENEEINVRFSPNTFIDKRLVNIMDNNIDLYWGNHTFLGVVKYEIENSSKNESYLRNGINSNLLDVIKEIDRLNVDHKGTEIRTVRGSAINKLMARDIDKGTISIEEFDKKEFDITAQILNYMFTSLYSDIQRVFYTINEDDEEEIIKYELFFEKQISGESVEIPFSIESAGTQQLLRLMPMIISLTRGKTVIIDEIDTEIHDLLMKAIIEGIMDIETGQLIATTHNTMLLQTVDKKNVFVIAMDSEANKKVINLGSHDVKIQTNNSLYNKYIEGEFGGIPFIDEIDLEYLQQLVENTEVNSNE